MFNEIVGNMWDIECDALCITTNGTVRKDGACVMGRGCAREAATKFPHIPQRLGGLIKTYGNIICLVNDWEPVIYSFPVKHNWWEKADLGLIEASALHLMEIINDTNYTKVLLPRPGCGNGHRDWLTEVKPILEQLLDERVYIVSK